LIWDTAEHCLLRGDSWIFGPEAPYERQGDVGYVTFPCGYTLGADGDAINLYYGAADTSVAMATGSVSQLLEAVRDLSASGASDADRESARGFLSGSPMLYRWCEVANVNASWMVGRATRFMARSGRLRIRTASRTTAQRSTPVSASGRESETTRRQISKGSAIVPPRESW
jgi:glycosyl hydrolase family 130 (putative beta-1,4-mannooligosaccharide phosphorylase)